MNQKTIQFFFCVTAALFTDLKCWAQPSLEHALPLIKNSSVSEQTISQGFCILKLEPSIENPDHFYLTINFSNHSRYAGYIQLPLSRNQSSSSRVKSYNYKLQKLTLESQSGLLEISTDDMMNSIGSIELTNPTFHQYFLCEIPLS